jgi:hypothetical protein
MARQPRDAVRQEASNSPATSAPCLGRSRSPGRASAAITERHADASQDCSHTGNQPHQRLLNYSEHPSSECAPSPAPGPAQLVDHPGQEGYRPPAVRRGSATCAGRSRTRPYRPSRLRTAAVDPAAASDIPGVGLRYTWGRSGCPAGLGSARIQHRVRKRREITSINRVNRTRERVARLGVRQPVSRPESPENPQASGRLPALEELPRHHHALDLIGPLVDLGDRGPAGSFRR